MAASLLQPWTLLAVLAGSALGGTLRHAVTRLALRWGESRIPWGTLIVNVSGAALAGVLGRLWYSGDLAALGLVPAFFLIGLLGSYTTVSALSLQTLELLQRRQTSSAILYMGLTLGLGLPATLGAWLLAGWLLP